MLKVDKQALIETQSESINSLYNKYGAMLLGYIFEIVNDQKLAEEYLVKLFCDLSQRFDQMNWDNGSSWVQLQKFAREGLPAFKDTLGNVVTSSEIEHPPIQGCRNQYFERLTDEQKFVFFSIYYHGKSVAAISAELNKTEDLIRKILKDAFAILRKDVEN